MSRGIAKKQALKMLTLGFIDSLLKKHNLKNSFIDKMKNSFIDEIDEEAV